MATRIAAAWYKVNYRHISTSDTSILTIVHSDGTRPRFPRDHSS